MSVASRDELGMGKGSKASEQIKCSSDEHIYQHTTQLVSFEVLVRYGGICETLKEFMDFFLKLSFDLPAGDPRL